MFPHSRKAGRYAAGVSVVALTCSLALAPTAGASGDQPRVAGSHSAHATAAGAADRLRPPSNASAYPNARAPRGGAVQPLAKTKGVCGTSFGPELPTPDGIISWNDTSGTGFDTSGAADVVCSDTTIVDGVQAYGYFGAPTETFHVTFYSNDPADGTNEPNDASVICDYPSLTGSAGGQYPTAALTTLQLPNSCQLPPGESWVSIQNVDSAGPWYWEMQNTPGGVSAADWRDTNNVFGSGCTTFDNDEYLQDCLGYTYPDWMLVLTGPVGKLTNLTKTGSTVNAGNAACPDQPYYLYSGGKSDNFAAPPDLAYPSPDLVTFMGSSVQGNVNYDVSMDNGRFGDSFNLQNDRSVCYAVIQFRAKQTGDIPSNDGLTFGHIQTGGAPFNVVGQVINPGGTTAIQHYALDATGLKLLSTQTGYFAPTTTTPSDSVFDVYLQDDTEIDFFRMFVWYGPNCAQPGGPYGGC